jgi:hypothetical protein
MSKPAGRGLSTGHVARAAQVCKQRAALLHAKLGEALLAVEEEVAAGRAANLLRLQQFAALKRSLLEGAGGGRGGRAKSGNGPMDVAGEEEEEEEEGDREGATATAAAGGGVSKGGINRNDPILQWSKLHQAAGIWE